MLHLTTEIITINKHNSRKPIGNRDAILNSDTSCISSALWAAVEVAVAAIIEVALIEVVATL